VFENTQLRILDVHVPPGDTSLEHRHDLDIVTVSMTAADTRAQTPGQPWGATRPRRPPGDAVVTEYAGKPASHRVENIGKTPYRLFAVENLRTTGWSAAPPLAARATTLLSDGRALRVYDVRLVNRTPQTSHTHAVPTVVVLVAGNVISAGSDKQAKALAPAPVGVKQLDTPGQWVLVPAGESHQIARLGSADAHVVEIEVR
jgi:hypothetical protein